MASFSMSRDNIGSSPSAKWEIYWSGGYFYITFTKNSDGYISGGTYTCYLTVDGVQWNFSMAAATGSTGTTTTNTVYLPSITAPTTYSNVSFYTTSTNFSSTGIVPSSNPITGTFKYAVTIQDRVGSTTGTVLGSGGVLIAAGTSTTPSSQRTTTYTGYTYSSDSPSSFVATEDKIVFRLFTANTYTVSYHANLSTGDNGTRPSNQTKTHGVNLTLSTTKATRYCTVSFNSSGGSAVSPITSNFNSFVNWNTSRDGSGTTYQPGGTYSANASVTLYAQWSGSYSNITLPAAPTKPDSIFNGWYTASTGGTRVGGAGDSYKPTASITLYAQWESGVVRIYNGSSFTTYVPYIYNGTSWVRAIPYVYDDNSWKVSV